MRGHIIEEERFLHQGIDHHLFVTASDDAENEYRFEVRTFRPGSEQSETVFEKTVDYTEPLRQSMGTLDQLIRSELTTIRNSVSEEEDLHIHDP